MSSRGSFGFLQKPQKRQKSQERGREVTESKEERENRKSIACGRWDGCQAAEASLAMSRLAEQAPGVDKMERGASFGGGFFWRVWIAREALLGHQIFGDFQYCKGGFSN